MTTSRPRVAILTWDYRQQPDLDRLARLVHDLSGGRVHLRQADTGSDQYALVVADTNLTDPEVADVWRRWWGGMLGDDDIIRL